MESLKNKMQRFKLPESSKTTKKKIERWQDYAASICKEFKISKPFDGVVFKKAKTSLGFLESKVAIAREKCVLENGKIEFYGRYLISLFRKKKPWE